MTAARTPTDTQLAFINNCRAQLAAGKGMTTDHWSRFDSLERQFFPADYKIRQDEGTRKIRLRQARELTLEDLQMLVKEKKAEKKA